MIEYKMYFFISPTSGTIKKIKIKKINEKYVYYISVFLNFSDHHIQYIPLDCKLISQHYFPGEFLPALLTKSTNKNENLTTILFSSITNNYIVIKQIAGLIFRKIRSDLIGKKGCKLKQGEQIGEILFGSRVDIYFATDFPIKLDIKLDQHIEANITPLFKF